MFDSGWIAISVYHLIIGPGGSFHAVHIQFARSWAGNEPVDYISAIEHRSAFRARVDAYCSPFRFLYIIGRRLKRPAIMARCVDASGDEVFDAEGRARIAMPTGCETGRRMPYRRKQGHDVLFVQWRGGSHGLPEMSDVSGCCSWSSHSHLM